MTFSRHHAFCACGFFATIQLCLGSSAVTLLLTGQHCNNKTYPKLYSVRATGAQARRAVLTALAALWALPADRAEWLTQLHKPELRGGPSEVAIGRAVLPVVADERARREGASSAVRSRAIACGAVAYSGCRGHGIA